MKFPYQMLRDYVNTQLTAGEVGDLLTMAGFELEGIEEVEGDHVLDVKVMSNRGDGLSVFGLSREVLAKDNKANPTDLYHKMAEFKPNLPTTSGRVSIETADCNRFACCTFEGVSPAQSPDWMQQRLRQAGQRPISLLVDLTNYVMLELGQPMHAFDLDTLEGQKIIVRQAKPGEKLTTLNGEEHELRPDQMMVCDAAKPVGAAGVMGGLVTEVTANTKRVLLESAHFLNTSVRRTRKQMGLNTEASYRFERSVDPAGVVRALCRFSELHEQFTGIGAELVEDVYPRPPEPRTIQLRMDRARVLLGLDFTDEEAMGYLNGLGFNSGALTSRNAVIAPTWRPDVVAEEDVVEEIGRVHGFDKIPEALPPGSARGGQSAIEQAIDDIRSKVIACGFVQCISHTLRDEHPLDGIGKRTGPRNPGSPDHAILRNSILPSLAEAAQRNGGRDIHLFEAGRIFGESESRSIAFLSQGQLFPLNRAKDPIPWADFYSLKGVIQSLAEGIEFKEGDDPRFHPTRQAKVSTFGVIGEIHPNIADELGLPAGTVLAELCLDSLAQATLKDIHYQPISRNPSVRRDIAFIVEKSTPYESLARTIKRACGDVLEDHWLFDVYDGAGIPDGKHSLAVALQLRKHGENFTDEEANQVREQAVSALESLGATVRK